MSQIVLVRRRKGIVWEGMDSLLKELKEAIPGDTDGLAHRRWWCWWRNRVNGLVVVVGFGQVRVPSCSTIRNKQRKVGGLNLKQKSSSAV